MASNTGVLLVLLTLTTYHHVAPMCAPDMKGRVCKDMMLPPDLSTCINPTQEDWPCHLPTTNTRSTDQDKEGHHHHNSIDFLENELGGGFKGRRGGLESGVGGVLEVSGVVAGEVQQVKGCEEGEPTTYPQGTIQGVPYVKYEHADQSAEYLLLMVDPDAPSDPGSCDATRLICTYLHWVVPHIPGKMLHQSTQLDGVTPLLEYRPPTPPSDVHRYQMLLFEMHAGKDVHDLPDAEHRDSFDLNYFIGGNNLCDTLRAAFQYRVKHV